MAKFNKINQIVVIGSTGLLGQALKTEARKREVDLVGIARRGAEYSVDATEKKKLINTLDNIQPRLIINTAAQVSIDGCEKNRAGAYLLNAGLVATLTDYCRLRAVKLCQISTDHYFSGDGNLLHDETCQVVLLNEYARTKYAGECFALTDPNNLILRTNIVGYRGWAGLPTFVEWAIAGLVAVKPMALFEDFYTSSIDVSNFSKSLFDLLEKDACGLFNLAARESNSKSEFILRLAKKLKFDTSGCSTGSIRSLTEVCRAESLGLNVSYAESVLGYRLPDLESVVESLAKEYKG